MNNIQYTRLKKSAGFRQIKHPAYLRVTGEDRIGFLQRQSTNDLKKFAAGKAIVTILTNPSAKILDVLTVISEDTADQYLGIICLPDRAEQTAKFLQSRIFFMDKVTISNISEQYCQFDIDGPLAGKALESSDLLSKDSVKSFFMDGTPICIIHQKGFSGISYRLIGPSQAAGRINKFLENLGIWPVDDDIFEIIRIEAGLPAPDQELNTKYTPLEMNLEEYISSDKGCYTGQEIIARQITYDKITRRLVGLRLPVRVPPGTPVLYELKQVGEISSSTHSPAHGFIALGILKRPFFEANTQVSVNYQGEIIPAIITKLPF